MQKTWRLLVPALVLFLLPAISSAQFGISLSVNVNVAPPELPVYEQPPLPAVGYIFVPGYWFWDTEVSDYVWIPGTWVPAPEPGYLWTPGYWGYEGGAYLWHGGYWGPDRRLLRRSRTTDSAIRAVATKAVIGTAANSSTTEPSSTSVPPTSRTFTSKM